MTEKNFGEENPYRQDKIPKTIAEQYESFSKRNEKNVESRFSRDLKFARQLLERGYETSDLQSALQQHSSYPRVAWKNQEGNDFREENIKAVIRYAKESKEEKPSFHYFRDGHAPNFVEKFEKMLSEAFEYGDFRKAANTRGYNNVDELKFNPKDAYDLMKETGFVLKRPGDERAIKEFYSIDEDLRKNIEKTVSSNPEISFAYRDIISGYSAFESGKNEKEVKDTLERTTNDRFSLFSNIDYNKVYSFYNRENYLKEILNDSKDLFQRISVQKSEDPSLTEKDIYSKVLKDLYTGNFTSKYKLDEKIERAAGDFERTNALHKHCEAFLDKSKTDPSLSVRPPAERDFHLGSSLIRSGFDSVDVKDALMQYSEKVKSMSNPKVIEKYIERTVDKCVTASKGIEKEMAR